jgi:hypothetical protein
VGAKVKEVGRSLGRIQSAAKRRECRHQKSEVGQAHAHPIGQRQCEISGQANCCPGRGHVMHVKFIHELCSLLYHIPCYLIVL